VNAGAGDIGKAAKRIRVLIIAPDGIAAARAREVGARLLQRPPEEMIQTPLSPTGRPPATHWLCENDFTPAMFARMRSFPTPNGTEVVDGRTAATAEILARRGLKRMGER